MINAFQTDIFNLLSSMSQQAVYQHASSDYLAIAVAEESTSNTNAVTIRKDHRVSFFTRNADLLARARAVKLTYEPLDNSRPRNEDGYRFSNVDVAVIRRNRQILEEFKRFDSLSPDAITEARGKV